MSQRNVALWLIASAVCGIFVLCAGAGVAGLFMLFSVRQVVQSVATQMEKKPRWTRDEFTQMVKGKTGPEVLELVGTPSSTSQLGGIKTWYYSQVTCDPVTKTPDFSALVQFGPDGKVQQVVY